MASRSNVANSVVDMYYSFVFSSCSGIIIPRPSEIGAQPVVYWSSISRRYRSHSSQPRYLVFPPSTVFFNPLCPPPGNYPHHPRRLSLSLSLSRARARSLYSSASRVPIESQVLPLDQPLWGTCGMYAYMRAKLFRIQRVRRSVQYCFSHRLSSRT